MRNFIDMEFLLTIIFLLAIPREFVLGKGIRSERSNHEDGLSYQELINMNVSCYPLDSCMEVRTNDSPVPTLEHKCSCHSQCWEYGTCCIDSPYRVKSRIQHCVPTRYETYYMVDRCPDNTHPDSIWRNHCEREVDGIDDILMISPVTSLDTSKTYKNYYCFRCRETTDNYVSWNIDVTGYHDAHAPIGAIVRSVAFNETEYTWVAILDEDNTSIPVKLDFVFPHNVKAEPMVCNDFSMYSNCPAWADKHAHEKCLAYSAIVYTKTSTYKNVHCALCKGVSIDDLTCIPKDSEDFGGYDGEDDGPVGKFFRCLMDINGGGTDGNCFKKDVIDKPKACKDDYHVWNPFTKKCQKTSCIIRGYVRKNDICVKP